MKNQKETETDVIFKEKEWYREKIVKIVNFTENETILKKIYTFAKTLNDISNKKEGD